MSNLTKHNVFEERGLYYKIGNDPRWHFNFTEAERLYNTVPDYWDDICPICGNKDNIDGCRCPYNHRYCKCGAEWHWTLDKIEAKIIVIIDKKPG